MEPAKKRKRNFYKAHLNKKTKYLGLKPGLKGFLCTCNNKEKECIREAFNILNEYGDKLYGSEHGSAPEDKAVEESDDIEEELRKEIKNLQAETKNLGRFNLLSSKATNCIFIQTKVPEPVELVRYIINDLDEKQKQRTVFLLRMIPVEVTCKAFICDIEDAAKELFKKYFVEGGKTFAIVFKRRNNSSLLRDDVIQSLARIVIELNPLNRADLKHPKLAVLVEVICNICCLSVAPDYFKFCKYNLLEICSQKVKLEKENKLEEIAKENIQETSVKISSCQEIVEQDADHTELKIVKHMEGVNVEEIVQQAADDTEVKVISCTESVNVGEVVKQDPDHAEVKIINCTETVNVGEVVKQDANHAEVKIITLGDSD